jgi:cytochrome c peroxidase
MSETEHGLSVMVPELDLQLSEMRSHNTTLISKEDLTALNITNEDLALTDPHIEHFLKAQHSLGKILYFDQHVVWHVLIKFLLSPKLE